MTPVVRTLSLPALVLGFALMSSAEAQPLQMSNGMKADVPSANGVAEVRTADFIVALVNSEPVTNNEVRQRLLRVEQQMTQQRVDLPPREELARQVMEQLIGEKAQLQDAMELGLRVDDVSLEQAELAIAAQNQVSLEEFRRRVAAQGLDLNRFKNELRNQLLLRKVRERETERVRVSNAEIEAHIRELNARNPERAEVQLSHVLIKVPENAAPDAVRSLQAKAQLVADKAKAGGDFATLAREYSDAPEGVEGGSFGWRQMAQLPSLFVQATMALPVGGVTEPVRSPAGWHVLKVEDRKQGTAPELMLAQSHASHILLRPDTQLSQEAALTRLAAYRDQVLKGQASFKDLARRYSQDGSASAGGDLGWVSPGQFVPEFEAVMDALQPGELSQPMVSRFGVHLILLIERREVPMTSEQQREAVKNVLRENKVDESLETWAQDVRARAYVEYRDAPRP